MFSRTLNETANKPALLLYGIQLSYFPHAKFLGITFDHKFTFKKHFEHILEHCQQKYHHIRMLVNQKWGPILQTILQIYKQCVRPIFEHGVISTITISDTIITKLQKLQNSFIRLARRLPRYPDGKPDRDLFGAVTSLSDKVILLGDINSKYKVFNCATTTTSGCNLKGTVKELKLTYLNNDEYTHGKTDILDMAFVNPKFEVPRY